MHHVNLDIHNLQVICCFNSLVYTKYVAVNCNLSTCLPGSGHCNGTTDSPRGPQKSGGFHHSFLLLQLRVYNAYAGPKDSEMADLPGHVFLRRPSVNSHCSGAGQFTTVHDGTSELDLERKKTFREKRARRYCGVHLRCTGAAR